MNLEAAAETMKEVAAETMKEAALHFHPHKGATEETGIVLLQ